MPTIPGTQRWRRRRARYVPPLTTINPREFEVVEFEDAAPIKTFVAEHHYSASCQGGRFRFALMRRGEIVGAADVTGGDCGLTYPCV